MLKTILRFTPAAAGLCTAVLFVGCEETAKPSCDDSEDECAEDADKVSSTDGGKKPDAGKGRDASVKVDAGSEKPIDSGTVTAAKLYLPCDVKPIVEAKCAGECHVSDGFGPMPLVTAADFQTTTADKQKMSAYVLEKINDPDPDNVMPPPHVEPLTADEKSKLTAWLQKGALGSDKASCETDPVETPDAGGPVVDPTKPSDELTDEELDCYKMVAHSGDNKTPFTIGSGTDAYFAFTFAAPWKEDAYGIVMRTVIDNKKALHHWLLFQDLAPGVPGGGVPQIGAHPTGQLIAAWAPGAINMDFRTYKKDVGLELPASTTYTLEMHYNTPDPAAKDMSGVEVCVAKKANKPKNIAAYSWLGYDNTGFPSTNWTGTCRPQSREPIQIVAFMPHMHLAGKHMKGTVLRKDGTQQVVHDKPFSFDFQVSYPADVVINPGDSIRTDCTYSEPKAFGQPTSAEMCYLFAMAYPKGALASGDIWGGIAHGASSCLGQ